MSVRLDDTTAAAVSNAIAEERFRQGSSAVGRVLTLVIVADEATQADAVRAAAEASREHPSRILVAIPRHSRGKPQLDAVISVGGSDGLGELAELRLRGPLAHHVASVVLPLLVPDAPVVVWWPTSPPPVPSEDPVGRLAQRRITDSAAAGRAMVALDACRTGYADGDTDLSWTRCTPWRALLASALDQPLPGPIERASVSAQRSSPSAMLLAAWLQRSLRVPVALHASRGPGITAVSLHTSGGDITISRPDGRSARMTRPGYPVRDAVLPRRSTDALIAEELRRLDADEIYGEVLAELPNLPGWVSHAPARRVDRADHQGEDGIDPAAGGTRRSRATAPAATKAAAKKPPATKAPAKKTPATTKAATKTAAKKPAGTTAAAARKTSAAPKAGGARRGGAR